MLEIHWLKFRTIVKFIVMNVLYNWEKWRNSLSDEILFEFKRWKSRNNLCNWEKWWLRRKQINLCACWFDLWGKLGKTYKEYAININKRAMLKDWGKLTWVYREIAWNRQTFESLENHACPSYLLFTQNEIFFLRLHVLFKIETHEAHAFQATTHEAHFVY